MKKQVSFQQTIRLKDEDTRQRLEKAFVSGGYDSYNQLINDALDRGLREILSETRESKPETTSKEVSTQTAILKSIESTIDEVYVLQNIIEALLATLYNIERTKISNETVDLFLFDSGLLSKLPEQWNEAKIKKHREKTKQKRS